MNKGRLKFWSLIGGELLLLPILLFWQYVKKYRNRSYPSSLLRAPVISTTLYVCIHEWGGYPFIRKKKISKKIPEFECGLKYQLERFDKKHWREYDINLTVTMSDAVLCNYKSAVCSVCDCFLPVSNEGMDFSGYNAFYEKVKKLPNAYILLSNSSVNAAESDFLIEYIRYMESNPDIGMLGISYNSKCYQTLIRNNFTPHLQSFFLLTTMDVLNQIIRLNKNTFPGAKISYKRLLIREGEIRISQLVLKLGYKLAVVTESGPVKIDGSYKNWHLHNGDYRCHTSSPNRIWPILYS